MKLSINDESKEVNCSTLKQWATTELKNVKGIAIAVNDCVVPGSKWNSFALKDGDRILVIEAAQGG